MCNDACSEDQGRSCSGACSTIEGQDNERDSACSDDQRRSCSSACFTDNQIVVENVGGLSSKCDKACSIQAECEGMRDSLRYMCDGACFASSGQNAAELLREA